MNNLMIDEGNIDYITAGALKLLDKDEKRSRKRGTLAKVIVAAAFSVLIATTSVLPAFATSGVSVMYTTDYVNVRTSPSLNGAIIDCTVPNTVINVTGVLDNGWASVNYNGIVAYMYSDYLAEVEAEPVVVISSDAMYTPDELRISGVLLYDDYRYTWYSENVLPGGGLDIPGRHVDSDGYICDENDYICLASDSLDRGTIVDTPLGKFGKVYDCGTGADDILDVYVSW